MKKRPPTTAKIRDHVEPPTPSRRQQDTQSDLQTFHACLPATKRGEISYILGERPKEEPPDIPRLFIRSGIGGSVEMDFAGLDVHLSEAAFAHWIMDESLQALGIHHGDIAIIDPMATIQSTGNLILLELDGEPVFRRLFKKQRVWFVQTADGTRSEATPLGAYPIQGIVLGITRLFTKVKAVRYCGTDANFKPSFERKRARSKPQHGERRIPKVVLPSLASEKTSYFSLSEMEEKPLYSARAKIR